jgi:hypothetical protein
MVAGEPNDVCVKLVHGQWVVRLVEDGGVIVHLFETQSYAENFAEGQRVRLNLPGKPPIDERH